MGSLISLPIAFLIQKVFNIQINVNIFGYLNSKLKQFFSKKPIITKKRFDFFDPRALNDLKKIGLLPNDKEFELELPNQRKNEDVSIIGLNSWGQALHLRLNWRPQNANTSAINVDFIFEDGKGNTYFMNELSLIPYDLNKHEYRAPGISLEILSPFRRLRIKFRGYLHKSGSNELVFVKFRILWIAISNVFDLQSDHNQQFISEEIAKNSNTVKEVEFEDRFEQFGQMKGTIQFNNDPEEKVFLWGNKSKKYEDQSNRQVRRLFGYSKKGWIFHIGSVVDKSNEVSYRYGFAYWGKTLIFPIEFLTDIDLTTQSLENEFNFSLSSCGKVFNVTVSKGRLNKNILEITINGHEGRAVYMNESETIKFKAPKCEIHFPCSDKTSELVLPLTDQRTENVFVSGGKGSSLASLHILSKRPGKSEAFEVPNGIIVTCNAYELMIDKNKQISDSIKKLKTLVSKTDELRKECENVVNVIKSAHLPNQIKDQIRSNLESIYGEVELNNKLFAVRSSASGEDSDEMSAAGQMTTYLGVKGLEAIYSSVMKCWSSQFEFVAVEYKRGYGQDIDSMMAVVIQEMVNCDSAGVLFTCDPLTGDEREIIITANHGIGESVVSALAEPDTIRVKVNITDNSFDSRTIEGIKSIAIGSKAKCIKVIDSDGGIVEINNQNQNKCCISDENAIRLADIALKIQKFYGSVRDIEWGIKNDRIFILQSRPVTNLDSNFTEFELMHELDVGLPAEREYLSKANVGEVLPGCSSHINLTFFMNLLMALFVTDLHDTEGLPLQFYCPYAPSDMARVFNHMFINLKNSEFFKMSKNESNYTKAIVLAVFGHEITDPDIREDCADVSQNDSLKARFWREFYLSPYMIYPKYFVDRYRNMIHSERYVLDKKYSTPSEMFADMCRKSDCIMKDAMVHIRTTNASSMFNHYIISLLSQEKDNPHIFTDFAYLMSQCGSLVSADVPLALGKLAQSIEDPQKFRELSDEEALKYLQTSNTKSSESFKNFIKTHGHRGYKEFDTLNKVWRDDPIPVIRSLKTMLTSDVSAYKAHDKTSTSEIIDSLKTPLNFHRKILLKYVVLPLARRAVAMREETKSIIVYAFDLARQSMWKLADRMHSEGLIPELDLIFHMTVYEIDQYFKSRNPLFITKAKQRKKLYFKMEEWKFDEIVKGYDFQPRNLLQYNDLSLSGDQIIKGTPVSLGKIIARVCVAPNLEDAVHIKPGDILVTYSTDIGWSPYFPMISGIATEIGGLVSHGAVIAREYGLPCLIGATGATQVFKTGDMVLLDCENGTMSKVSDHNQNRIIE